MANANCPLSLLLWNLTMFLSRLPIIINSYNTLISLSFFSQQTHKELLIVVNLNGPCNYVIFIHIGFLICVVLMYCWRTKLFLTRKVSKVKTRLLFLPICRSSLYCCAPG